MTLTGDAFSEWLDGTGAASAWVSCVELFWVIVTLSTRWREDLGVQLLPRSHSLGNHSSLESDRLSSTDGEL